MLSSLLLVLPQVLVVGPGEPFVTIQPAIDAAQDGDVVLVRPGTYAGFVVDGKSLVVHADGAVTLTESVEKSCIQVQNVPAGSRVVVRGFFAKMTF